ncbi:MAG: hypothetical protein WD423_05665 [Rhodothermales bacterium]
MIISPEHKYVFVENPRTACTAIANELRQFYGGEGVLFKHATYQHFVEWAGREEAGRYFIFAGIRSPMDDVVTEYFKLKSNHRGEMTDPSAHRKQGGWVTEQRVRQYAFIQRNDADFASYFRTYYHRPYVNRSVLARRQSDFVIRFEDLQADFSRLLQRLDLQQVRPLPVINPTAKPARDHLALYDLSIRPQAFRVFGPVMKYLGYTFPDEWDTPDVTPAQWAQFYAVYAAKMLYWRFGAFRKERVNPKTYDSVALQQ